jgi:hypothetical protein
MEQGWNRKLITLELTGNLGLKEMQPQNGRWDI